MTSLRELIEDAQSALDTYKYPDTNEVESRLDEILTAGKLGSIKHDHLESLSFYQGKLCIHTSYSVRGCSQTGAYTIPETVIDSVDPVAAIKVWAKEQRIAKAQHDVNVAERQLNWYREKVIKAQKEE